MSAWDISLAGGQTFATPTAALHLVAKLPNYHRFSPKGVLAGEVTASPIGERDIEFPRFDEFVKADCIPNNQCFDLAAIQLLLILI